MAAFEEELGNSRSQQGKAPAEQPIERNPVNPSNPVNPVNRSYLRALGGLCGEP